VGEAPKLKLLVGVGLTEGVMLELALREGLLEEEPEPEAEADMLGLWELELVVVAVAVAVALDVGTAEIEAEELKDHEGDTLEVAVKV